MEDIKERRAAAGRGEAVGCRGRGRGSEVDTVRQICSLQVKCSAVQDGVGVERRLRLFLGMLGAWLLGTAAGGGGAV